MSLRGFSIWRTGAVVLAATSLSVCGGGGGSGSGGGPTVPVPPISTPTPTPAPPPTEPPVSASCAKLPPGNPNPTSCVTEAPTFLDDLQEAMETLRAEQPGIFNGNTIVNLGAYYVGLIKILDRKGLCADFDTEELGIADSKDFSDVFDIQSSKDEVRMKFLGTCYPSLVPMSRTPLYPVPAGCNLPPSREIACGREREGRYYNDVSGAVDQLMQEKPELFDFTDLNPGTDGPRVRDLEAYHRQVVEILIKKGYCVLFDTEEIQIKRTNEFTEHYDINYRDEYVRRGSGIYRGSCYPAAF